MGGGLITTLEHQKYKQTENSAPRAHFINKKTKIYLIEFHKKNTVHDIVQKVSEDCMDSKSSHESDNDSIDFSRIQ